MATSGQSAVPIPALTSSKQLPDGFQRSCAQWMNYPRNVQRRTAGMSPSTLAAYHDELKTIDSDLFVSSENEVEVCFRDFGAEGKAQGEVSKLKAHSEKKMWAWLGIEKALDPNNPKEETLVMSKLDPKSRFIYIYGSSSRHRLQITRSMLAMILSFHQVMPEYLDFIMLFGNQVTARDMRFSGFRRQEALKKPPPSLVLGDLGRSGQQFELVYNLKGVTKVDSDEWRIRNAAFYHRYDIVTGRTLWIVTKGGLDIYQRYQELTSPHGRPEDMAFGTPEECFASSLSPHVLFFRWSSEDWRGYIRWLEESVEKESGMAMLGPWEKGNSPRHYQPSDIRRMQVWEELASEAIVVLEGNLEVISSLQGVYRGLAQDKRFPHRKACAGEITDFINQLDAMKSELRNIIGRCHALVKVSADRKELIKLYREDDAAARMHRLNKNMEEDTIMVRIVTLVTLVYLPATFVSTFFSTDIIKYQEDNYPDGKYSKMAMERWLQVTVPLTVLTLLAAWAGNKWTSRSSDEPQGVAAGSISTIIPSWLRERRRAATSTAAELLPLSNPGAHGKSVSSGIDKWN
ncbi:hypothetical protein QBC43DRAFT_206382 [Cladorrhinum sp. PSN259]|nr:hypothetical protein QBC43DRAFT_206382 [Cladorrhinum sp. PSN259]